MRLVDVMDEIGSVLDTIPGLRVHAHPVGSVVPPAAVVQFPSIDYDSAFQRGLDRWEGGVAVLVGTQWDRVARDNIAAYVDGHSARSVHAALRAHDPWVSCSYARATRCTFPNGGYTIADITYVAAQITLDIAGPGT